MTEVPAPRADARIEFLHLISGRRSASGTFTAQPISSEHLTLILECGLSAPSSKNANPWRLHIVAASSVVREIADVVELTPGADRYAPSDPSTGQLRHWPSSVTESANFLRHAAAAIFIENRGAFSNGRQALVDTKPARLPDALVGYTFEVLGLGAAIQNMLLAASALGIQGRFMGDIVLAEEYIKARLNIETDLIGVVVLGYSDVALPPRTVDTENGTYVVWHNDADL
jgi:nitroreductase